METAFEVQPRGILNPDTASTKFRLTFDSPGAALEDVVEYYWSVVWDLRGQPPYRQENLPHPSVHLAFTGGRALVHGVVTGKFSYLLEDRGWVLGVKFRPGAFRPFIDRPVAELTDREIEIGAIFGAEARAAAAAILAEGDPAARIARAERLLLERRPAPDAQAAFARQAVETIVAERAIVAVDDVASRFGVSTRTLQRLFREYVGVGPKWVIRRYRLHEAAEQLAAGSADLARLAVELGYFDQAHFINDFRRVVGKTPAEYLRGLAGA